MPARPWLTRNRLARDWVSAFFTSLNTRPCPPAPDLVSTVAAPSRRATTADMVRSLSAVRQSTLFTNQAASGMNMALAKAPQMVSIAIARFSAPGLILTAEV